MFAKARLLAKIGSWAESLKAYDEILTKEKTGTGKKIDATMEKAKIALLTSVSPSVHVCYCCAPLHYMSICTSHVSHVVAGHGAAEGVRRGGQEAQRDRGRLGPAKSPQGVRGVLPAVRPGSQGGTSVSYLDNLLIHMLLIITNLVGASILVNACRRRRCS